MEFQIVDFGGGNAETISVPDEFFAREFSPALVQQVLQVSMACGRQGTRAQKTRAEVRHTTKKMFRQKGTGRARAGHSSTPIRRGGGRAFPSRPDENFTQRINRRMFRAGMAAIFSRLVSENRFFVVRDFTMDNIKTKEAVQKIADMKLSGNLLFVDTDWEDDNCILSCANIPSVSMRLISHLLPTELVKADCVVFSQAAVMRSLEIWHEA